MDDSICPRSDIVVRPERAAIFEVASEQSGYFTAAQAHGAGYGRALLSHHVKSGRFIRVTRGLYRLREYPSSPHEHVVAAWLAAGKGTTVVSHESALDLLDLSDVIPNSVHLTVPRSRRYVPSVTGVTVHTTTRPLSPTDRTVREGIALTSPARSIVDAADAGTAPEQIEMAVHQATDRGLTTGDELRRLADERGPRVAALIDQSVREAGW